MENLNIKELEILAESGDQFAQYTLGNCYLDGDGVTKDLEKGMNLIKKSAEQGNDEAKNLHNSLINHNLVIEEEIYFEEYGTLKYYLSNDFKTLMEIELMQRFKNSELDIDMRGGFNLNFEEVLNIKWILNDRLSENVKNIMNKHNVNFSMTEYKKGNYLTKVYNKRKKNKWFIFSINKKV